MRNESKWGWKGPNTKGPGTFCRSELFFLKDLSEINSDTTRKMMIYT